MGSCISTPISISDKDLHKNFDPPAPKIAFDKSQKILEECLDPEPTTSISTSEGSEGHQRHRSIGVIHHPDVDEDNPVKSDNINLSWNERRNSDKEKHHFVKSKTDLAKAELQRRLSLKIAVHSKCPICGDLGPETSNQYYTFYLVVPNVITKTKCRRCNVYFSFEYVIHVKSLNDAINLVLDEEL